MRKPSLTLNTWFWGGKNELRRSDAAKTTGVTRSKGRSIFGGAIETSSYDRAQKRVLVNFPTTLFVGRTRILKSPQTPSNSQWWVTGSDVTGSRRWKIKQNPTKRLLEKCVYCKTKNDFIRFSSTIKTRALIEVQL